ncbi:peptide ABC transporter substrate-binding protein [Bacillus sp. SCS-151]|uniref:peptide ABC transporter substrate-binding protein n=1 Tax=Nanhaiella sioensis TaxID=3115293 RepID=UPI00397D4902
MKKRTSWLMVMLTVVLAVVLGLAGCNSEGASQTSDSSSQKSNESSSDNNNKEAESTNSEQVYNTIMSEPTSLSPVYGAYTQDLLLLNNIQEGLMRKGQDGATIEYGLAESHDFENNTYTFYLRDATWSNGEPITAYDFEFGWKTVMDPRNAAEYGYLFEITLITGAADLVYMEIPENEAEAETAIQTAKDAVGVKALDDKTLEIKVDGESPAFLELLAFPSLVPIQQQYFEEVGGVDVYGTEASNMLYAGPFVVEEWSHDEVVVLAKNEKYWDKDTVQLDKINMPWISDDNTRMQMYEQGDIDGVALPSDYIDQYANSDEATLRTRANTWWFVLNQEAEGLQGEYLRNAKFREALAIGFDRAEMSQVAWGGTQVPAGGIIPPGMAGSQSGVDFRSEFTENSNLLKFDFDRAKQLIEEAKAEIGEDVPEFELIVYQSDDWAKTGQYLQQKWGEIGVPFTIKQTDSKIRRALMDSRDYNLVAAGWTADYDEPSTYLDLFVSTGSFNKNGYVSEKYDQVLEDVRATNDMKEKFNLYAELERIVVSDYAYIPLSHDGYYSLERTYVDGIVTHAVGPRSSYKWASVTEK